VPRTRTLSADGSRSFWKGGAVEMCRLVFSVQPPQGTVGAGHVWCAMGKKRGGLSGSKSFHVGPKKRMYQVDIGYLRWCLLHTSGPLRCPIKIGALVNKRAAAGYRHPLAPLHAAGGRLMLSVNRQGVTGSTRKWHGSCLLSTKGRIRRIPGGGGAGVSPGTFSIGDSPPLWWTLIAP